MEASCTPCRRSINWFHSAPPSSQTELPRKRLIVWWLSTFTHEDICYWMDGLDICRGRPELSCSNKIGGDRHSLRRKPHTFSGGRLRSPYPTTSRKLQPPYYRQDDYRNSHPKNTEAFYRTSTSKMVTMVNRLATKVRSTSSPQDAHLYERGDFSDCRRLRHFDSCSPVLRSSSLRERANPS